MTIKFICLNLWTGGRLFDEIVSYIQKEQPDILACQEVYNGHDTSLAAQYRSIDALQGIFQYPYVIFDPCFIEKVDGQQIEQGNAIFSKFPITDKDVLFFDQQYSVRPEDVPKYYETTPRNMQHATVTINDTTALNVFNVQGIWGTDGEDNSRRLAMGQAIADFIGDKPKVLLTGDFNVRDYTETIKRVANNRLTNIFQGEFKTTFNMRHKTDPVFAESVIDMLFVSPDVTVKQHYASDADVSDHLSLVAVVAV